MKSNNILEFIENKGIKIAKDADKVINGKEHGSGMVVCSDTINIEKL